MTSQGHSKLQGQGYLASLLGLLLPVGDGCGGGGPGHVRLLEASGQGGGSLQVVDVHLECHASYLLLLALAAHYACQSRCSRLLNTNFFINPFLTD